MADSFITQCPHCQVKFKLTEAQLNAAKGSVRCGACLNVFNAKENLAKKQPAATPPPVKKPEKPVAQPESNDEENLFEFDNDPDDSTDDLSDSLFADMGDEEDEPNEANSLFSDLDNHASEYDLSNENQDDDDNDDINSLFAQAEDDLASILEDDDSKKEPAIDINKNNAPEPDNQISDAFESLDSADSIFDEIDSNNDSQEKNDDEEDFIFGVDETNEFEIDDKFLDFEENASDAFSDDALIAEEEITEKIDNPEDQVEDESWTNALLNEEQPKENKAVFKAKNLGESNDSSKNKSNNSFYGEQLPKDFENDVTQTPNEVKGSNKNSLKSSVNTIAQDTQDLDNLLEKSSRGLLTLFAWSFMSAILVACLVGQYIYFNFDHVSNSKWRPQIIQLCEVIGCKAAQQNKVAKQITINKFEAIEHPELDQAVKILFVLRNTHSTNIEYPNITVQVFDTNNMLIGDQTFAPSTYLPNQIKSQLEMPAKVDVQADISIKDLGNKAVRYQLVL